MQLWTTTVASPRATARVAREREDAGWDGLLVVDSQNRVQPREIQTGLEDPARVEVISGLSEGDRVIVGNFGAFQPGQVVEPKMTKFNSGPGEGGAE